MRGTVAKRIRRAVRQMEGMKATGKEKRIDGSLICTGFRRWVQVLKRNHYRVPWYAR